MDNMNTCQGMVFGRALLTETLEDLAESLKSYQVSKIERIESMRGGKRSPNGLHILTFSTRTLPEQILCGYEKIAIRQYYPNPLRCMVCCQYGHTKNWCKTKEQPICKDCGKTKNENECQAPKKCVNCAPPNDGYSSFDKDKRKHNHTHEDRSRHLLWDGPKNLRRKNTSLKKKHMLKLLASSSMTSPEMRQMNCKILRKKC
jgi:hypothetical protein